MTALYEKIAKLPPSLLPKVERFVDSLPKVNENWDDSNDADPDWSKPLYDENGKKVHPQPGCMKGTFVIHDNFFEPDDVWDDPDFWPPPIDENGKRKHPQPGCMKGMIIMKDNFFEPDDDWEEYM